MTSVFTSLFEQFLLIPFLGSFFMGYYVSFLMIRYVAPIGFYDLPRPGRINSTDVIPRTGGLAFLSCLFLLSQFSFIELPYLNTLLWGTLGFLGILGLADDFSRQRPIEFITPGFKTKYTLIVSALCAVSLLQPFGFSLDWLATKLSGLFLGDGRASEAIIHGAMQFAFAGWYFPSWYPLLFVGLTLLCWGLPNLFNLMDGLDGLALGYFGLAIFVVMRYPNGELIPGPMFWGLWAAILYLNLQKVHYLGEVGSLALGLFLAIMAVLHIPSHHIEYFFFLFAYPILDGLHVTLLRWKTNRPLGVGDLCHFHHFVYRLTGERLQLTLPLLWGLAFLPMLRLWGRPIYQDVSLAGLGILIIALSFSFTLQLNEPKDHSLTSPE